MVHTQFNVTVLYAIFRMSLLTALCRANQAVLKQKIDLINALIAKHDIAMACDLFRTPCPIVKATIGQHIRHSMDHMERAVTPQGGKIHYDLRNRDTAEERDCALAEARIGRLNGLLEELAKSTQSESLQSVDACFMLSGDSGLEYSLPSTVARELGFAAHHAIHHMAMVKIIATNPVVGGLLENDLPADFGRAPSTVHHDQSVSL